MLYLKSLNSTIFIEVRDLVTAAVCLPLVIDWNAAVLILRYWVSEETVPSWAWCILFWAFFSVMTTLGVKVYGELEYIFGMFKFLSLVVLFFISILANVGAFGIGYVGFRYWNAPIGICFSSSSPGVQNLC